MNDSNFSPDALRRILQAERPPRPWRDGGQLPWSDPGFSSRMLSVHLDPDTHMASRRPDVIERHLDWLVCQVAMSTGGDSPYRILDVGCGPGLYCHGLARRGHAAVGFDFAPASLAWARDRAAADDLDCRFLEADLADLPADLPERGGGPFDAVTFWFGEFNAFPPDVVERFLPDLARCLKPGGLFVLEYQPWDLFVQEDSTSWTVRRESPFSERPHLWLEEFAWNEELAAEIHVHWIVEAESGNLARYAQCNQAWRDDELTALLTRHGLVDATFHPPVTEVDERYEFPVLITRRAAATDADSRKEPFDEP